MELTNRPPQLSKAAAIARGIGALATKKMYVAKRKERPKALLQLQAILA
ncbi:hypothetical protein [Ralstonia edaphi]|nr:hypothetical protein [Ralstonia sp. LMG 6871]